MAKADTPFRRENINPNRSRSWNLYQTKTIPTVSMIGDSWKSVLHLREINLKDLELQYFKKKFALSNEKSMLKYLDHPVWSIFHVHLKKLIQFQRLRSENPSATYIKHRENGSLSNIKRNRLEKKNRVPRWRLKNGEFRMKEFRSPSNKKRAISLTKPNRTAIVMKDFPFSDQLNYFRTMFIRVSNSIETVQCWGIELDEFETSELFFQFGSSIYLQKGKYSCDLFTHRSTRKIFSHCTCIQYLT